MAWFLVAGGVLVVMSLVNSRIERLPVSASLIYLLTGVALSPAWFGLIHLDPLRDAHFVETLAEIGVLVSLFTTGLKIGTGLRDRRWAVPVRLATLSMVLTVAGIALVGVSFLGLSVGAAILLGGILAPTDPVLASEVQVEHHEDRDRLRFGLTGEAGLNDGTAAPLVALGLGLLGLRRGEEFGWRWLGGDLLWPTAFGLAFGFGLGWLVSRLVLYLRQTHQEAVGREEFLTLGLIALAYGGAQALHANGFLAVFAAGLALRRVQLAEQDAFDGDNRESAPWQGTRADAERAVSKPEWQVQQATDPGSAPGYLARKVLTFNEQFERLGQVALVVVVGAMLIAVTPPVAALWFVPTLFLVIRPVSVFLGLLGVSKITVSQQVLMSWFGIRGIGSVYYLAHAVRHGLEEPTARLLTGLVLATIATSVVIHGVSVNPLMQQYTQRMEARQARRRGSETQGGVV